MTDTFTQESTLPASLVLFGYFQLLDLLTTVGFIVHGVKEANPIVRFALTLAPTPIVGLALVKVAAIAMAFWCSKAGKQKLLGRINVLFAILISWNMFALIAASV